MLRTTIGKLIDAIFPMVMADVPVIISGPTGVGKSEVIENDLMARIRLTWSDAVFHDYRFGGMETSDRTGLPDVYTADNGERCTRWTRPAVVPQDDGRMHVFFLDEMGHVPVHVQQVLGYGFTKDRRLGEYALPKLNRVIMAMNTKEDKAGDNKLVPPLCARAFHVHVNRDMVSFLTWGVENGIDKRLLAFWKAHSERIFREVAAKKADDTNAVFCERTAAMLSRVIANMTDHVAIENVATAAWGQGIGIQFAGFVRDLAAALPRLSEIQNDPNKCRVPTDINHHYAIASAIADQMKPENCAVWCQYLKRLSADVASMAAHQAKQKNPALAGKVEVERLIID